jgi:hypothetical protein
VNYSRRIDLFSGIIRELVDRGFEKETQEGISYEGKEGRNLQN